MKAFVLTALLSAGVLTGSNLLAQPKLSDGQMPSNPSNQAVPAPSGASMQITSQYGSGVSRHSEEMPPVYPAHVFSQNSFAQTNVPQSENSNTQPQPQGSYWQGVYWPYQYGPYEQGSYWPYKHWPYENDQPWQGSPWPYEPNTNASQHYRVQHASSATLEPGVVSNEPLSNEERAELEMWRRLSREPLEVTFYGTEAYVKWSDSASRIPVPQDGKLQIKLNPALSTQ